MRKVPLYIIHKAVANYFGVGMDEVFVTSRKAHIVILRQWFHYLAKLLNRENRFTLTDIGAFGKTKYDHATVLNSCNKIQGLVETYAEERIILYEIKKLIDLDIEIEIENTITICRDFPLPSFTLKRAS